MVCSGRGRGFSSCRAGCSWLGSLITLRVNRPKQEGLENIPQTASSHRRARLSIISWTGEFGEHGGSMVVNTKYHAL